MAIEHAPQNVPEAGEGLDYACVVSLPVLNEPKP